VKYLLNKIFKLHVVIDAVAEKRASKVFVQ
jgi:hypothetical protein